MVRHEVVFQNSEIRISLIDGLQTVEDSGKQIDLVRQKIMNVTNISMKILPYLGRETERV